MANRCAHLARLPLLDYIKGFFFDTSLSNTYVIGAQHILETTFSMFDALSEFGLKKQNIFLIGKCYSSCSDVKSLMENSGMTVSEDSFFYDSHQKFDSYYETLIRNFLKISLDSIGDLENKKFIIIDDGGYLIQEVLKYPELLDKAIGIEQTSSGYQKIKNLSLPFPVINVARSFAKTQFESPMIATKVVDKLHESISSFEEIKRVLILGNGFIGKQIKHRLEGTVEVDMYDSNPYLSEIQHSELYASLPNYDMIIGSTGVHSFPYSWVKKLKRGAILVSTSSSDREFCAAELRCQLSKSCCCHLDIQSNGIRLLNSGFPINFDGKKHSVSPKLIQFTRALLMLAILQSNTLEKSKKGLIELDEEYQRIILKKFRSLEPHYFKIFYYTKERKTLSSVA